MQKKIDRHYGLDVVRAIAITAVVLYHWPREQSQVLFRVISHFGYLGVDLFFVLSGYLIVGQSLSLIEKNTFTPKRFYISRLMRTLPNYYFVLFASVLVHGVSQYDWRYLFFLQNFGGLYSFSHSWSLCVEEHFYLFLPFILVFLNRSNMKRIPLVVAVIVVVEILIRLLVWIKIRPDIAYSTNADAGYELFFKHLFYPSYTRMDGLALGSLVAYIKQSHKELWIKLTSRSHFFFFGSLLFFLPVAYLIYHKTEFFNAVLGNTLVAIFSVGILISCISEKSLLQRIRLPGITLISMLSYSIYLTHGHALHLSEIVGQSLGAGAVLMNLIRIVVLMGLACILYFGLEKPILRYRDRILLTT